MSISEESESQNEIVELWPHGAPGALGEGDVDRPSLEVYLPEAGKACGAAMVICPGGGYGGLAAHEGRDYALFLNQQGLTAFVLKYRLGSANYRHPVMLQDASRALRLVRAGASRWNVSSDRIGIMGSSAGGHLASTLLTHYDAGHEEDSDPVERVSSRPDFGVLCYAVISMSDEVTHTGSRQNLLGPEPTPEQMRLLSAELNVTPGTPPCFIWHTWEDGGVKVENSLQFAAALRRQNVPFDLHIYTKGGHGIGLAAKWPFERPHPWALDLVFWLNETGIISRG
ncbi:MAG: alpha/beta hydrolase [bacterium]